MPPSSASASVTAGLRCAPDTGPNIRMRAVRAAPVAIVLASKANAVLPADKFWAMIPEPTTVARRKAVPKALAVARLASDIEGRVLAYGPGANLTNYLS